MELEIVKVRAAKFEMEVRKEERLEEIESELDDFDDGDEDDKRILENELSVLQDILDGLKGYGGDVQWRGDWYPITLIHESYFVEYCEELVKDVGDLPKEIPSYIEIDWDKTAENMKWDYSSIEIDGNTYYYR